MQVPNSKPNISLRDYLVSTRDIDAIETTMDDLSRQLQRIHNSYPEYSIDTMNVSSIGYDEDQGRFYFLKYIPMKDKPVDTANDKENLAKIFMGAYLSINTGVVSDYTALPTGYIKENIGQILEALDSRGIESGYFKEVFQKGDLSKYYHEYKERLQLSDGSNKGGQTYFKSLPGFDSPNESDSIIDEKQAAFINAVFYPTLMLVLTIVVTVLYKCFEFINK